MSDVKLKIDNVHSWLDTRDQDLKDLLSEKLRFRPKNFWHSSAYKKKKWDGYKYFFDKKSGKFLTGLLPEIKAALRVKEIEYTEQDARGSILWNHESIDQEFLNNHLPKDVDPITLHDFQPDLANQCFKYDRGIVKLPTGAGKTFVMISLLKSLPPKTPVLFLTNRASLVDQNYEEMKKWGVPNLGRWYDKHKEPNYVMCCTVHVDTLKSIERLLPKFKVLIVDEVHECVSDVPVEAYKKMTNCSVRIGFSATPFRWNKKVVDQIHKWSVKGHFGPVFKTSTTEDGSITTKDLQDRKILTSSECYFHTVTRPDLKHEPYQDAVKLGIEQNFHFHELVVNIANSCPGRTLIIVERIEQGEYLSQLLPGAYWIQGKDKLKDRAVAINALKRDEKCIAIVMRPLITAGIDIKIHDLINAAGGEGAHNAIQLMGRGLRPASDKDNLRYHDFLFKNNKYLQGHSEWRIEVLVMEGHDVTIKDGTS